MFTKNTTTLYVGDTSIRLMVTSGRRITKLADVPLDVNLSEIDSEEKETELVNKIKLLFKTNKISSKKVILGISGLHCLTRPVILPELPRTMMDEAVRREARRVLPVPVDQLYISWQAIETIDNKIQAFMVGIPREIADTLIRLLNQAGYKPILMDIKPLALARLAKESTAIIVDVQPSEFDIVIMVNGIPQPIRTVPFEQDRLIMEERMAIVKDELRRTVQFFNQNNPDNGLQEGDTMLVSGELLEEPEVCEELAVELGFKVAPLTSPLKCMKQLDPTHHLANVGLALKVLVKDAGPLLPDFNTLPLPYQPKQVSMGRIIAIPTAAVAVGSIVLLGMTIQNAAANITASQQSLEFNNLLLERRVAQKQDLTTEIAEMEQQLDYLRTSRQSFTAALNWFNTRGDYVDGNLVSAADSIVDDLLLGNLNHSETLMTLAGQADNEAEIIEYVRNLEDSGRFQEVTISNLVRHPATENSTEFMVYTITLKLPENIQ